MDAETGDQKAEAAFERILSWKTGSFEILPGDASRARAIFTSYQGLLLNTAQALDEAASQKIIVTETGEAAPMVNSPNFLAAVSQLPGVEFVLAMEGSKGKKHEFWGVNNPEPVANWTSETLEAFNDLGDLLQVGQLQQVAGTGPQRKIVLASEPKGRLVRGFSNGAQSGRTS